ncbi:alpha/beta hydrolase [Ornithinimicrobium avium]|uniref:Alpha/beta hydrolase n=1 Tax=Ornithinimicrobium avium TaxID=2283195 RepID=A0A345NN37_9MICO|nr:alpha/beta hydrolase [Ornithinimicrobium avium]AXH96445.1 alpha/beta hydrolase [Ornithinimicrobium avium]
MDVRDLRPPVEDGPWPPATHHPPLDHPPPEGARTWTGLTYAMVDGYRPMVLDLHVPLAALRPPVVLWVHGGGWREGDRRLVPLQWGQQRLFQRLVDAGLAVATVDYRLLAESSLPGPVHDVVAAVRYLRRYADELGVDASRLALWGESAGAHLAAVVALAAGQAHPDQWLLGSTGVGHGPAGVTALVGWYGVYDLTLLPSLVAMLWPDTPAYEREELARRLSPVRMVAPDSPPMLLLHGEADTLVPVDQSVRLHEAARAAGARSELEVSPGSEHVFAGEPVEPRWERTVDFLAQHLR